MKNFLQIIIIVFVSQFFVLSLSAADFTWVGAQTVTLSDNTGCNTSTYTFLQTVPDINNARINSGDAVTITFPAGTDASTCTGGDINGTNVTITTATATQVTFNTLAAYGKLDVLTMTLNGITNGNSINSSCAVAIVNRSGGSNSGGAGSYTFTTTACATSMTYTSSTVTQTETSDVLQGSVSQQIIGIEIVTTGTSNAIDVTSFSFNTTGTTSAGTDIQNAKLWSTGTSSTFATTTQIGSTVGAPNGAFSITPVHTLVEGTNYFWLTYDIQTGATVSNVVDAQCTSITVDGSSETNATTSPAGNRQVVAPPALDGAFSSGTTFAANGITTVNDATNYWIVGTATHNGAPNSAYITNDGSANTYSNNPNSEVSHFYFDFTFPAGETIIDFDFDWKCVGESSWDNLKVYIAPTTITPVAGSEVNSTYIVGDAYYSGQSTWQSENVTLDASNAGTTKRIIFSWKNDASGGTNPPAAVDNIAITTAAPAAMVYSSSTTSQTVTADVVPGVANKQIIGIEIVTTGTSSPIDVTSFSFNTSGTTVAATDIQNAKLWSTGTSSTFATSTQLGSTVGAPNGAFTITPAHTLVEGTNYFWLTYDIPAGATVGNFVDAECISITVDGSARTPAVTAPAGNREIVATPSFDGTFSSGGTFAANSMIVVNDSENVWVVGTATHNGAPNCAYISDDAGATNAYNVINTEVSHFYFDYVFPAGETMIDLSFDWKCDAEATYDYLKVYLVPTSTTPSAGSELGSGLISTELSGQSSWQSENITLDAANAGTTQRIVFSWKNDASGGTMPPAAVDNILISTSAPAGMAYSSSTVTQTETADVSLGNNNQQIIGIEIVTTGTLSPVDVSSFSFNTTGTTAPGTDIQNAKLWSTGSSSTFATTTQVGATVAAPNGNFTINPSETLSEGTNYFWLTYDITGGATINNFVDAECTSVTVDGSVESPTVTAPAGNRKIVSTITLGTGTATTDHYPYYNAYENEKTQMLFLQSELGASALISTMSMDFNFVTADANMRDFDNFTIKLMHTSETEISGAYEDMTAATTVFYSADYGMPSSTGWNTWDITDFAYNGTDNLVVEITWGDNGEFAGIGDRYKVNCTDVGFNSVVYGYHDSETPPSYDATNTIRPNVQFGCQAQTNMVYQSCTVTQNNVSNTNRNRENVEVICLEVVVTGSLNPLDATSFSFNTNGTTDEATDISNAKLWFTGNSPVFVTSSQIGSTVASPNGAFTISDGTASLQIGTNYFWLTYDVTADAVENDFIDAECTSVTVDASVETPTVTAPAGSRQIVTEYCTSTFTDVVDEHISNVTFNTINNTTAQDGADSYGDYTAQSTNIEQGLTYTLSVTFVSSYSQDVYAWIDWNQDGDFTDSGEEYQLADNTATTTNTLDITIPIDAVLGQTRMRVMTTENDDPTSCETSVHGETEDYTVNITVGTPMSFTSLTATQPNTSDVMVGSLTEDIICVEITMAGATFPQSVSSFVFSSNGSSDATSDFENVKLWYTGTSSTFATNTQIGSTLTSVDGAFTLNGTQTLQTGINYFWLSCDVAQGATAGNFIDAELTSVTINGSEEIPGTSAPAGNREILACGLGTGVASISLPYSAIGESTNGAVDDFLSTDFNEVCGDANYYTGEDYFYTFVPNTSGNVVMDLTSAGSNTGMVLYNGCPLTSGTCVKYSQSTSGNESMCAWVDADDYYYLMIDSYSLPENNDYDISISAPTGDNTGHTCATAHSISSLPFSQAGLSTACTGNDYDAASSAACSSSYLSGEDYVFSYTIITSECINVELDNCGTAASVSVYKGCPDDAGSSCIGTAHNSSLPFSGDFALPFAGTYYIVVDSDASADDNISFDISVTSNGSAQSNDLPCNAIPIALGSIMTGDNTCASGYDEPTKPWCWDAGEANTVWYTTTVPASGKLYIRTELNGLSDTQIAAFRGACDNLTLVNFDACNNDQTSCGSNTYKMSELDLTGLTVGETIYIVVDGKDDLYGTFTIAVIDGDNTFPPAFGQDCGIDYAIPICSSNFDVGNPGYQAVGNYCDFEDNQNCLLSGERGTAWYLVDVDVDGDLEFALVPNDYNGTAGDETDYDFAIWKVTGTGAVTCADIEAGSAPLRCNYSSLGVTGLYGTGSAIAPHSPDYDAAFESSLPILAGEQYLLVISNYANSTSGFNVDLQTSPLIYPANPTSLTWTGGAGNTDWFNPLNWGNCGVIPDETIDVEISPSSMFQPIIDRVDPGDGTNARCKSITINPGANVTVDNAYVLEVHGDYYNYGTFSSIPGSEVQIKGTASQSMQGNMTGLSKFQTFRIEKTGGNILLNNDIEVAEAFITVNGTSIIDVNDLSFTLGGDFTLFESATFTGTGLNSVFTFNGYAQQNYNTGTGADLEHNNVVINNTSGGIVLLDNLVCSSAGSFEFTSGIIDAGVFKVICKNTLAGSVSEGNTDSYVNGVLEHYITTTGLYNLPVGDASIYALAQVESVGLAGSAYLDAEFMSTFTNTGLLNATKALDGTSTYSEIAAEGIWRIDPDLQPTSGTYNILLHFDDGQGYDVLGDPIGDGFSGLIDNLFAPLKRNSGSTLADDWEGEAVGTIPSDGAAGRMLADGYAKRTGISAFSEFAIGKENVTLPVELIEFTATCENKNVKLSWSTVSEFNNDYYTIFRSNDGDEFEPIAKVLGQGTSFEQHDYAYLDESLTSENHFYRIMQTDFDGKSTLSDLVFVSCVDRIGEFSISPNPFSDNILILFDDFTDQSYVVGIYDMFGKLVYEGEIEENVRSVEINAVAELQSGTYLLNVISSNEVKTRKLIKL